jgi:hypothetical protein
MTTRALGTFDVKLTPPGADDKGEASPVGRMTIDKQFHGDLEGTSKGEMLTAMTAVQGSAGYVAIERVTGTLRGRKGTFALQHTGIMNARDALAHDHGGARFGHGPARGPQRQDGHRHRH